MKSFAGNSLWISLVVVAAIVGSCLGGEQSGFVVKPYLLATGRVDMTVMWTASTQAEYTVRFGQDKARDRQVTVKPLAESIEYATRLPIPTNLPPNTKPVAPEGEKVTEYRYLAQLSGLKPGTGYGYEVAGAGQTVSGEFVTMSEPGAEFTFIAASDSQTPELLRTLSSQFGQWKPRLIIHSGDLVSDGSYPPNIRNKFFEQLGGIAGNVPIMPTVGNHDSWRWVGMYFPYAGGRLYYSFDCGDVHFVCLNSFIGAKAREAMISWLDSDLGQTKARWKILYSHIPSYDSGGHQSGGGRGDVLPMCRKYGVDLVFSGHTHAYQRYKPMFVAGENEKHPITYIVTGGSSFIHRLAMDPYLEAGSMQNNYLAITVSPNKLAAKCFSIEGKQLDAFEILKNADGEMDPAYVAKAVPESGFGTLRALVRPCVQGVALLDDPMTGKPARVNVNLAGTNVAMKFTIRRLDLMGSEYDVTPVSGELGIGETKQVALTLQLREPAKYTVAPMIRLECVFDVNGQKASAITARLIYKPPEPVKAPDGKAQTDDREPGKEE